MQFWKLNRPYIAFCFFVQTKTDDLFDIGKKEIEEHFRYLGQQGAWHLAEYEHDSKKFIIAFYRFRVIVFYFTDYKKYVGTDEFIRETFLPLYDNELPHLENVLKNFFKPKIKAIYCYPLVFSPKFKVFRQQKSVLQSDWLDDGVTTFYYRIFDSTTNKAGFIRVSKWLTISYGLGSNINRELVNLTYEHILYKMMKRKSRDVIIGEDEFALLDGLAKYTVPTELNLFLQGLAIRVAVYIAVISIALSVANSLLPSGVNYLIYVVIVLFAIVAWAVMNKFITVKS